MDKLITLSVYVLGIGFLVSVVFLGAQVSGSVTPDMGAEVFGYGVLNSYQESIRNGILLSYLFVWFALFDRV